MRNINLLPKTPVSQKIFVPALSAVLSISILAASGILYSSKWLADDRKRTEQQIATTQASIQTLTAQRQVDATTRDYTTLLSQAQMLIDSKVNWSPILTLLTSSLPKEARMLSATVSKEVAPVNPANTTGTNEANAQNIQLSLEFAGLTQAAEYMMLLQRSELIAEVAIQSVVKTERTYTPIINDVSQPADRSLESSPKEITAEQLEKSLTSSIPKAQTEADELLNQLAWTINQGMASQQFGIKLPDKNFTDPAVNENQLISPLTKEDLIEARRQLDAAKQLLGADRNATTSQTTEIPDAVEPDSTLHIYQVSLNIELHKAGQEKVGAGR